MKNTKKQLLIGLASAIYSIAGIQPVLADDTEIFFAGTSIGSSARPNVMFILDNSGSMNEASSTYGKTRMDVLQDSFESLIDNTNNVNIGLMRLWENNSINDANGVYHPVKYIDDPLSQSSASFSPKILQGSDDAVENTNTGTVNIEAPLTLGKLTSNLATNDTALPLSSAINQTYASTQNNSIVQIQSVKNRAGFDKPNGQFRDDNDTNQLLRFGGARVTGVTFTDLNIPANSIITSAYVDFYPWGTSWKNSTVWMNITAEDSANPAMYSTSATIGSRNELNTVVPWNNDIYYNWHGDNFDSTPDLKDLVQEAVDKYSGIQGISFHFRKTSGGNNSFDAYKAPTGPLPPQLRLTYTSPTNASNTVGLRFQEVPVPQGATITSAYFKVVPRSDSNTDIKVNIKAENSGNANTYTNSQNNISSRSYFNSSIEWEPQDWERMNNQGDLNRYSSPELKTLVQGVVNRTDWCGGNAMAFAIEPASDSDEGFRIFESFEDLRAPQLVVEYDPTSAPTGCINKKVSKLVNARKDDAQRYSSVDLDEYNLYLSEGEVGLRYQRFPIKKGATIVDAYLEVTASQNSNRNITVNIAAHDNDNSPVYNTNWNSISGRTKTSNTVDWTINSNWSNGNVYRSNSITDVVQEVVNRDGWQAGNSISFILDRTGSGNNRDRGIHSWDGNAGEAPRLVVVVNSADYDGSSELKVRDQIVSYVDQLSPGGGTPITNLFLEAKNYFNGSQSPITNECQTNHIVILSDGEPNTLYNETVNAINNLPGTTGNCSGNSQCSNKLAAWLTGNDLSSSVSGKNNITTHTISFGGSSSVGDYLRGIAENGEGSFYSANNAAELSKAFKDILQGVLETDSSFVSPSATVNQFNRLNHRNEIYYALFKPSQNNVWAGNVKRYKLDVDLNDVNDSTDDVLTIMDSENTPAVNENTGQFEEDAISFWSTVIDGNNTALGGAAEMLPDPNHATNPRKVYTDAGQTPSAANPVLLNNHIVSTSNDNITRALLDIPSTASNGTRNDLINWARGLDDNGQPRNTIGDPLHSQPTLATYGCTTWQTDDTNTPQDESKNCLVQDISIIFGTNQGMLHLVNANTGVETFSYIPQELLKNIKTFKDNAATSVSNPKPYGLDGSPVLWIKDLYDANLDPDRNNVDSNGNQKAVIQASKGDRIYAYIGMRRGGQHYYAFDLTNRATPKLIWKISPSTTGFSNLGQTWSTPVKTTIKIGIEKKDVLIFGGGYDPDQDSAAQRSSDTQGNSIYIVDALTGTLLWSGGKTGHTLNLNKMNYSIPSPIRVIDINSDGMADQMFFGDMGGQVWRLFINNGSSANNLVTPLGASNTAKGVMANLALASNQQNTRRLYNEPTVALLKQNGQLVLTVGIGSGFRAHPLNEVVQDRFYLLKTRIISANETSATTMTESNLYDATDNLIQDGSDEEKQAAQLAANLQATTDNGVVNLQSGGWFIKMESGPGEKVLSRATAFDGDIMFVTYEPEAEASSCKPVTGINRLYGLNMYDGTPALEDDTVTKSVIQNSGIIDGMNTLFLDPSVLNSPSGSSPATDDTIASLIGTKVFELDTSSSIIKTFWIDEKVSGN
ncbi:PilC/PilY family type IV pilus protein [Parendozoicomonas haliclonae]|uniref:PilY1 beta-propeller domain-containing protein n=1 Tax=Parendozoicomonas haliclonae TaxID=1960125 RepID=A0A1X7AQK5_9GAMM|nr:PilC/PilY family type IV pilus protein [Parendozoicomonas haliclonae]SMA50378.1 hypothetical protein EHSB41UT_04175 [Parendozoicomonas haliclonae]